MAISFYQLIFPNLKQVLFPNYYILAVMFSFFSL